MLPVQSRKKAVTGRFFTPDHHIVLPRVTDIRSVRLPSLPRRVLQLFPLKVFIGYGSIPRDVSALRRISAARLPRRDRGEWHGNTDSKFAAPFTRLPAAVVVRRSVAAKGAGGAGG